MIMSFFLVPNMPSLVVWQLRKTAANRQTDSHNENLYIDTVKNRQGVRLNGIIANYFFLHF